MHTWPWGCWSRHQLWFISVIHLMGHFWPPYLSFSRGVQCDQISGFFSTFGHLQQWKFAQKYICQSRFKILPNSKWTVEKLPKTEDFAKVEKVCKTWSHCRCIQCFQQSFDIHRNWTTYFWYWKLPLCHNYCLTYFISLRLKLTYTGWFNIRSWS